MPSELREYDIAALVAAGDDAKLIEAVEYLLDNWREFTAYHVASAARVADMASPSREMTPGLIRQLGKALAPSPVPIIL